MQRLIDANATALEVQRNLIPGLEDDGSVNSADAERYFLNILKRQPTVEAEAVRYAEWEDVYGNKYSNHFYRCSACREGALLDTEVDELGHHHYVQALSAHCPHCGARMKGVKKND